MDIIDRLRDLGLTETDPTVFAVTGEAIKEITRLRERESLLVDLLTRYGGEPHYTSGPDGNDIHYRYPPEIDAAITPKQGDDRTT